MTASTACLVVGATGLVGATAAHRLRETGGEVRAFVRGDRDRPVVRSLSQAGVVLGSSGGSSGGSRDVSSAYFEWLLPFTSSFMESQKKSRARWSCRMVLYFLKMLELCGSLMSCSRASRPPFLMFT